MVKTIMYAAAMLAMAATQKATLPTKVVKGSVVPRPVIAWVQAASEPDARRRAL